MKRATVAGTAKDPTIQFATLELDGQKYKLCYDYNAIADVEDMAGCNLLQGLDNLAELTAKQLRGLFWAALTKAQPRLTLREAGAMIRKDTLPKVCQALAEAYQLSMPEPDAARPHEAEETTA